MSQTDVLLIYPVFGRVLFTEPVGICCLASYLLSKGYSSEVATGFVWGHTIDQVVKDAVEMDPRSIGVSINAERELASAMDLADALRSAGFVGPLIAGGAFAGMGREDLLAVGSYDYVVLGDGEEPMEDLLVAGFAPDRPIPGVAALGNLKPEPRRNTRLQGLPWMDRSVLAEIRSANGMRSTGIQATISSGRGCFASCSFCSIPTAARENLGPRYRERPIGDIVGEMRAIHAEYGIRDFYFCSAQFTARAPARTGRRIAEFKEGSQTLGFLPSVFLYLRADNIERDVVEDLKAAGVTTLFVGVESFHDPTLEAIRKGLSSSQIVKALEILERAGYSSHYSSPLRLKLGFIMFTPWIDRPGLLRNTRLARRFGIPPKKLLYSIQVHPVYEQESDLSTVERNSVTFAHPSASIRGIYGQYRILVLTMFDALENVRALQKSQPHRDDIAMHMAYDFLERLNSLAYDCLEAMCQEPPDLDPQTVADPYRVEMSELIDAELDEVLEGLGGDVDSGVRRCAVSHLNRGLDNPQVLGSDRGDAVRFP